MRIESTRKNTGEIPLDNIYVDGFAGSRAMTRYLNARGHRAISMIAGRGGPQDARVEGYRAALAEAGGTADVVLDDQFNEEGGFRASQIILAGSKRPTAIFAANDLMAIGALQALRAAGLTVPA